MSIIVHLPLMLLMNHKSVLILYLQFSFCFILDTYKFPIGFSTVKCIHLIQRGTKLAASSEQMLS